MKAIVSRNELLAALIFSSTDDSRYVLNGVCIETEPGKSPRLIATDGRRLAVIQTLAEQSEPSAEASHIILQRDFIHAICALSKAIGGKIFPWIQIDNKPGSKQLQASLVGGNCVIDIESGALIEGIFPKWRDVVPTCGKEHREPTNDLGLNAEYASDFLKAGKLLDSKTSCVQMSIVGKDAAIEIKLIGADNFYGLLMQVKTDDSINYQPEFLGLAKAQQK